MTEERIKAIYEKQLSKKYKPPNDPEERKARDRHIEYLMPAFRAVAAEAREEGIDEMQNATCFCEKCLIPGHRPLCAVCEAAERLKEKGK